jgi:hypothetical protein
VGARVVRVWDTPRLAVRKVRRRMAAGQPAEEGTAPASEPTALMHETDRRANEAERRANEAEQRANEVEQRAIEAVERAKAAALAAALPVAERPGDGPAWAVTPDAAP